MLLTLFVSDYQVFQFGETQIKRMVRILRSTVMVRVGGGWVALEEFLHKHDPCRGKYRKISSTCVEYFLGILETFFYCNLFRDITF